ncbi:rho family-interacting cell polarization regulator 2-like isoform X3 [Tachypleus tridentatus]|uniref:rho family-interacting cell polarization regulator 2-like isoform X3 n=1 Tax=Tachypleus tridentatus TaxID=6853 RepID=UPI003FD65751
MLRISQNSSTLKWYWNGKCDTHPMETENTEFWNIKTQGFCGMPISEHLKTRHSSDPTPGELSYSRSTIGYSSHHQPVSSGETPTGSYTDGSSISGRSSSNSSTLSYGHHCSPNTIQRPLQVSSTWSSKRPRVPRLERTLSILQAVNNGLRECIKLTQDDIVNLRTTADGFSINTQFQGKLYEMEKQYKIADRYLKRLEFQLMKLEELQDQYEIHQKMRDGVCTMAYAYIVSQGKEKESALHSVHSGYKECSDILCNMEAELEHMMGTMLFEMKGIQGFARLCAGDMFEVTIKNAHQKWKTKGKVLKNENQIWDNKNVIFKAHIAEVLFIKAVEVKGFGKNKTLGHKLCDTKDLFSAYPQLMTVNLNPNGSLKLNVVVTWNPLHICTEDIVSQPLPPVGNMLSSSSSRQHNLSQFLLEEEYNSSPGLNRSTLHHQSDKTEMLQDLRVELGCTYASVPSSTVTTPEIEFVDLPPSVHFPSSLLCKTGSLGNNIGDRRLYQSPTAVINSTLTNSLQSSQIQEPNQQHTQVVETKTSQQKPRIQSVNSLEHFSIGNSSVEFHLNNRNLYAIICNLGVCLEKIQGQYPELLLLEQTIGEMERIFRKDVHSEKGSADSKVSMSVESALECFDFLNSALDSDSDQSITVDEVLGVNPSNTVKTSDSGIASITQQLIDHPREKVALNFGISLQSSSSDSEQLYLAVFTHLMYCQHLIENLGSCGPLKCQKVNSIDKLRKQATVLTFLLDLIYDWRNHRRLSAGRTLISKYPELQHLWDHCSGGGEVLCLSAEQITPLLTSILDNVLDRKYRQLSIKVSKHFLCKVLDVATCYSEAILTVFQLQQYYENQNCSLADLFNRLADEVTQIEILQNGDQTTIKKLLSCKKSTLSSGTWLTIAPMLTVEGSATPKLLKSFLNDTARNSTVRKRIISIFLEGLETDDPQIRQGSCCALAALKAFECTEFLAYLSHTDEDSLVRHQAKNTLFKFGEEGKRACGQF